MSISQMFFSTASGIVATGGTITTFSNYKVHTFTGDGTFQITSGSGQVEYLIVAGGGGGSDTGGAGAGGMLTGTFTVSTTSYPIVIGAGAPQGSDDGVGTSGANSSAFSLTAIGGGYGGSGFFLGGNGGNGGSGGGAGRNPGGSILGAPGQGTAGQGNRGGNYSSDWKSGGGGGAGQVGGDSPDGNTGGNGGNGLQSSILDGNLIYYAGGGGAGSNITPGSGGLGGGGRGKIGFDGTNVNGVANTGGGGGGGWSGPCGAGGSGIVIIRYLI